MKVTSVIFKNIRLKINILEVFLLNFIPCIISKVLNISHILFSNWIQFINISKFIDLCTLLLKKLPTLATSNKHNIIYGFSNLQPILEIVRFTAPTCIIVS